MEPVMTQPTEGDIRNTWETEEGSINLSWMGQVSMFSMYGLQLTGTFF